MEKEDKYKENKLNKMVTRIIIIGEHRDSTAHIFEVSGIPGSRLGLGKFFLIEGRKIDIEPICSTGEANIFRIKKCNRALSLILGSEDFTVLNGEKKESIINLLPMSTI